MYDLANISWNRRKIGELHTPTFFNGSEYVTKFVKGYEYYNRMLSLYDTYKNSRYVPFMQFEEYTVYTKDCGLPLSSVKSLTLEEKEVIGYQVMDFVDFMFKNNIAHRDLHKDNICWDGKQIWIIDWESVYPWMCEDIKQHPDYELAFMSGKDSVYNLVKPAEINLNLLPFTYGAFSIF
jgi:thiamine kinase-like enzyme